MKRPAIIDPWQHNEPTLDEARALKAYALGEATPEQQKLSLRWIVQRECGLGLDTFVTGKPDLSAYLAGKRSVGVKIQQVLLTKIDHYRNGETD